MNFFDIMTLVGAVVVILATLALVYYASRWYARRMGTGGGKYVRVLDKTVLNRNSALYVIKAGGRYYLVGAADRSVAMLGELEDFEETAETVNPAAPFSQVFGKAVKRWDRQ